MFDVDQKPMLARLVRELPAGDMLYEPKWDGFRCLAYRDGAAVDLRSRHGRPLARYFPEIAAALEAVLPARAALDGELLVLVDGRFDFPALMARLHPAASRVRELARRTPAVFVAFDLLGAGAEDLRARPLCERRARLVALLGDAAPPVFVTPATNDRAVAARWLQDFRGGGLDGVVAKPCDGRYEPGARAMLKVKHERTADCVVAGVRGTGGPPRVSALLLGLFDEDDRLEHIGVASSFARTTQEGLARELAPLVVALEGHPWEQGFLLGGGATGRLKGAAGRWEPGMTMDWVPLAPTRVCEVSYTQIDGRRLRHPAKLVRWRPDRAPTSCRMDQLEEPLAAPGDVLPPQVR
ncbi:MAG TPA: ATP-dependent DNA ligase [Solirubrobacteraceae bacterium]|nr:ATP-dependent DNA ligase [Solirubrobacteraceae bacterium]